MPVALVLAAPAGLGRTTPRSPRHLAARRSRLLAPRRRERFRRPGARSGARAPGPRRRQPRRRPARLQNRAARRRGGAEFDARRKIVVEGLNAPPGARATTPKGAFTSSPTFRRPAGGRSRSPRRCSRRRAQRRSAAPISASLARVISAFPTPRRARRSPRRCGASTISCAGGRRRAERDKTGVDRRLGRAGAAFVASSRIPLHGDPH